MGKQFRLYISHLDAHIEGSAKLDLPAGPYELQDALERARVSGHDELLLEIYSCRCDELQEWFNVCRHNHDTVRDVYALNALAEQMEKLESWNMPILGGAVRMEAAENPNMPLSRLCDLAESLDSYIFADAPNDEALGRFYVNYGFLPELDDLPESVIEKLDFEKIGHEMREAEGGIFLKRGYLVRSAKIPEKRRELNPVPQEPDYAVLLAVGFPDCDHEEMVKLPASVEELVAVANRFEAHGWSELTWRCADCKIPALADQISMCDSITEINIAAKELDELSGIELLTCKALISVMEPKELTDAMELIETRGDYVLSREIASPADVGMSRLKTAIQEDEVQLLAPHVNLYAYGESAMKKYGMELTDYGGLERMDGEPIHSQREEHTQERGGLEMM